jgi:hypothetical protein
MYMGRVILPAGVDGRIHEAICITLIAIVLAVSHSLDAGCRQIAAYGGNPKSVVGVVRRSPAYHLDHLR